MSDKNIDFGLNKHKASKSFSNLTSRVTLMFLGCFSACLTASSVNAGEKLYLSYGPLMFPSLRVESLELFAEEGKINKNLAFYLRRATPEQQAKFREALLKEIDINPVTLSRFFNSHIGEDLLARIGKGITIQGGSNGKYALRGALVQAAFAPEGLTLLNVFKKLPTNMQLQGESILGLVRETDKVILATETLLKEMRSLTTKESAATSPVDFSTLPDLRKRGGYKVSKQTWILTDKKRDAAAPAEQERQFYVDVYVPQPWRDEKTPIVIFSHGLSSRPEDFAQGLKHLASYGYLVAAPQHPGSDTSWLQEMLKGYHRDVFDLNEFINRPKDISYVIDELQRRNRNQFQGKLDLESVGVIGHSFGGYTALAVAGAQIDFKYLQQECDRLYGALNISLLLQCRALELPRQAYHFRDRRVKAVFAVNPVNRAIFGPKGISKISIPVVFGSGSYDPAAPPVFEQAGSFTWLSTPNKYLMMVEGQAHVNFNNLDAGMTKAIESVAHLTLPSQNLIANYATSMGLAFFEVYLNHNNGYRRYLQSSYAEYLSQNEQFRLDFISKASSNDLAAAMEKFKKEQKISSSP